MLEKINPARIVKDHHDTLRADGAKKVSDADVFLFWISPFLVGATLTAAGYGVSRDLVNTLVTVFSVFAALLFNLLMLMYSLIDRMNSSPQGASSQDRRFLKEIYSNTSFSVLLSITTVSMLVLRYADIDAVSWAVTWLATSLSLMFLLVIALVLKRVHILLGNQIDRKA